MRSVDQTLPFISVRRILLYVDLTVHGASARIRCASIQGNLAKSHVCVFCFLLWYFFFVERLKPCTLCRCEKCAADAS